MNFTSAFGTSRKNASTPASAKKGSFWPPNGQNWWLVVTQISLPFRIKCHVGFVVTKEVQLGVKAFFASKVTRVVQNGVQADPVHTVFRRSVRIRLCRKVFACLKNGLQLT